MECRTCGQPLKEIIFQTDRCPQFSHKYLTEADLAKDGSILLTIFRCARCGLMQSDARFPPEEYSADYQRNISFSPAAVQHIQETAELLFKNYPITNFVEIGCGNGLFSAAVAARGIKVVVFEPSRKAAETAKARGLEVHNTFFDEKLPAEFSGYDGFAIRFVLEHIDRPVEFLRLIRERCRDGAIGLVEVPNARNQLNSKRWYEFFREHFLYFTPETLVQAASMAGFEVIEVSTSMNFEFLKMIVRKPAQQKDWGVETLGADLRKLMAGRSKVAVWGASGACVTLLGELAFTKHDIAYIIDSDPNKWGLFTSGSRLPIVAPDYINKDAPDTIIIMTSAYQEEIRKTIREMGFKGRIGTIFPAPRWMD